MVMSKSAADSGRNQFLVYIESSPGKWTTNAATGGALSPGGAPLTGIS